MPKLFISYRRDGGGHAAGRVHDRLAQDFGADLLFMDVDNIPLGSDFVKVLRDAVSECDVLLAIINDLWLDARNSDGNRRLDNEKDFVRIEIATALQRDIPVVPILLDGAKMPKERELPHGLEGLATRNGIDVRHASFRMDMDRLIGGLRALTSSTGTPLYISQWTAKVDTNKYTKKIIEVRKSKQTHIIEWRSSEGLWVDGLKVCDAGGFFSPHCIFTIGGERFDLIAKAKLWKPSTWKLEANKVAILEWDDDYNPA